VSPKHSANIFESCRDGRSGRQELRKETKKRITRHPKVRVGAGTARIEGKVGPTLLHSCSIRGHNAGSGDTGPTPIPAPTTEPVLAVSGDAPLVQAVAFRDVTTPDRRGKPEGVTGMMLAVAVAPSDTPPATPEAAPIHGVATRQPYRITFPAANKGKVAFYFGRWITGAGKVGPWSAMAQLMIAG
jgi:hypothetical protein